MTKEIETLIQINVLRDVELALFDTNITSGSRNEVVSALKALEARYRTSF